MGGGNAVLVLCFIILIVIMLILIALVDEIVRKGTICSKEFEFLRKCREKSESNAVKNRNTATGSNGNGHTDESRPLVDFKGLFRQFSQASLSQMDSKHSHSGESHDSDEHHLHAPRASGKGHLARGRSDSLQLASAKMVHLKTFQNAIPENSNKSEKTEKNDFTIILTPPQSDSVDNTS